MEVVQVPSMCIDAHRLLSHSCFNKKIIAGDGAGGARFGSSVYVDGNALVVAALHDNDSGINSGSVYVYRRSSATEPFENEQKITADDGDNFDTFGYSVSVDGNTLVVGARLDNDDRGEDLGSVYVYRRSSDIGSFVFQQKIIADDGAANDRFGHSVSVDGNTLVVGAIRDDDRGSVYVYRRSSADEPFDIVNVQKIFASDRASGDEFGYSVSVDGNTLVVGALFDDDRGTNSGSVYVYRRSSATEPFGNQQKIRADDGAASDYFGESVSVDGNTLVVGVRLDDDRGTSSGSVYVYTRSSADEPFGNQQKIRADDGAASDYFGSSVSVDGNTIVVGAYGDDGNGSVYVYKRPLPNFVTSLNSGNFIMDSTSDLYLYVDNSIIQLLTSYVDYADVSKHENSIILGIPDSSIVSVYDYSSSWSFQFDLYPTGVTVGDEFGKSVSVYSNVYVAGAPGYNSGKGAVYAYVREPVSEGGNIASQQIITDSSAPLGDNFGKHVDLYDNTLTVLSNSKVYVYKYNQVNGGFLLLYTHTGYQPISSHTINNTSNSFIMVDNTNCITSIKPNVTTTTGTVTTTAFEEVRT